MASKQDSKAAPKKQPPSESVQTRLPVEEIARLDKMAKENNITRGALIGIACARILKSGL